MAKLYNKAVNRWTLLSTGLNTLPLSTLPSNFNTVCSVLRLSQPHVISFLIIVDPQTCISDSRQQ